MKNVLWILAAMLIVGLAIGVCYEYNEAHKPISAASVPVNVKQQVVKQFTDSLTHQAHTVYTTSTVTEADIKRGAINQPLIDTISRALDIKANEILSWQRIAFTSQAEHLKAQKTIDSLKHVIYTYSNEFIALNFNPDSDTFGYKYKAKITETKYQKTFLGMTIGQARDDISLNDKNATINGDESFSVKPNPPFFSASLKAYARYGLGDNTLKPGLGVEVNAGRFILSGSHYFDTNINPVGTGFLKHNTTVGLGYRILSTN